MFSIKLYILLLYPSSNTTTTPSLTIFTYKPFSVLHSTTLQWALPPWLSLHRHWLVKPSSSPLPPRSSPVEGFPWGRRPPSRFLLEAHGTAQTVSSIWVRSPVRPLLTWPGNSQVTTDGTPLDFLLTQRHLQKTVNWKSSTLDGRCWGHWGVCSLNCWPGTVWSLGRRCGSRLGLRYSVRVGLTTWATQA